MEITAVRTAEVSVPIDEPSVVVGGPDACDCVLVSVESEAGID